MKLKGIVLRPLALFCFSFYLVSCVIRTASAQTKLYAVVALCTAFIISVIFALRRSDRIKIYVRAISAACIGAAVASSLSFAANDIYLAGLEKLDGETVRISGVVEKVSYTASYNAAYIIKTDSLSSHTVRIQLITAPGLEAGNTVTGDCEISALEGSERLWGTKESLLSDGAVLSAMSENVEITGNRLTVKIFFSKLNDKLCRILDDQRAGDNSGIAAAVFLGNRSRLPAEISRDFRRLGISHVLALSGMHLSVVCAAVSMLSKRLGARGSRAVCAVVITAYMAVTGMSSSVCRAGIMLLFMFAAGAVGRRGDSFTNLGIAVFILSAADPLGVCDISLQLSAAAVFAILLSQKKLGFAESANENTKDRSVFVKLVSYIKSSLYITVSVVMFTMPLMWLYFGYISLMSPAASLVFSLLATILLWLTPLVMLLSPAPHISEAAFFLLKKLCDFIASLSFKLSDMRGITVPLSDTVSAVLCVMCFAAFIVFSLSRKTARCICGTVCALLIASVCLYGAVINMPAKNSVIVDTASSKTNDGAAIISNGEACIIDMGNGHLTSLNQTIGKANELGCYEIELLVLTHSHTAYPSSLDALLSSCKVRHLALPQDFGDTDIAKIEKICELRRTDLLMYQGGETVVFAGAEIHTYENMYIKRSVQPIIRFDVTSRSSGESFVYLGSAYSEASDIALPENCRALWLGNHGPKYKKKLTLPQTFDGRLIAFSPADEFVDIPTDSTEKITCLD